MLILYGHPSTTTPTSSLLTPVVIPQALEQDLEDLKERVLEAEGLQEQLDTAQARLSAGTAEQQQLQQQLTAARSRLSQLEYDLRGKGGA